MTALISGDRSFWDDLDSALAKLRALSDAEELADNVCALAISGCGADAVALGRVEDGVWTPWLRAGQSSMFDIGELIPPGPVALTEAPELEQQVFRSGRSCVRASFPIPGRQLIVAAVASSDQILGVLHIVTIRTDCREIVEAFADALASMFALIATRQRVEEQKYVLERLVSRVAYHPEPPVELLDIAFDAPHALRSAETNAFGLRHRLTPRQGEVLDLMMQGLSNTEIAERLVLAVPTVKSHVRAVLRASGAVNRSDALARFTRDKPPNTQIRAQRIHRR
ncbi:response regulator transcription factor [Rhodococcus globerulus]|uniref:response regulator transcription factor n=1 Tax=Rhodococcus globerulus TaxID=33008 RepID=UPI001F2B49D1|nr:LuxR family transcriptional regulator [Rhodococcus globerulus]MCE4268467.1 hypothetical protein [Rhodococcus globerulus]